MTAVDLRAMADLLDRLTAAGFDVALEVDGDLIIRATPVVAPEIKSPSSLPSRSEIQDARLATSGE